LTLLVGWQGGYPACKKLSGGCWHGYLSGARCRLAQLMPLPLTVCCFSKIQIVLPFWYRLTRVEKELLNGCVCVCLLLCICAQLFLNLASQVLKARETQYQEESSLQQRKLSSMRIRPSTQFSHGKKNCCWYANQQICETKWSCSIL